MEELEKETRAYAFEMRAGNDEKNGDNVTGTPIVFGSRTDLGWYDEVIERGALDKTDLKDVRFLVNHNTDGIPLARSRNNNENSTMQMKVTEDGMDIRVNLDTKDNAEAKSLYSAISRGDVSGMSFMFTVRSDKWENLDSDHPTRRITDIGKVYEVSAVTWPAYEATTIQARSKDALDRAKAALESARAEQEEARMKALEAEIEARERELHLLELTTL